MFKKIKRGEKIWQKKERKLRRNQAERNQAKRKKHLKERKKEEDK